MSPNNAADKQELLTELFRYVSLTTPEKFGIRLLVDPRLAGVGILGRGVLFNCFHDKHLEEGKRLYEILVKCHTYDDFLDLCHQARDFVNPGLFAYAVSVAVITRPDCVGITLPPVEEIFPDKFVPVETIFKAVKESNLHPEHEEVVVSIEDTGNILDPEHQLSYYREDIGINAHHWHWHLVYPATWRSEVIGRSKDRKGELFYYMHEQMCARYDCERLSNGMRLLEPFSNFREPLEGYSAHLSSMINGLAYASRPEGTTLRDIEGVAVQDLEMWRDRILASIDSQHVEGPNGENIYLDSFHGIDILGSLIESSYDSVNRMFYGNLHNSGHVLVAAATDPKSKFELNPGVMSDSTTSLRDPIFYRWHRFLDDVFQRHKEHFTYTESELQFRAVEVDDVSIEASTREVIKTCMKDDYLDLSHSVYFNRSGPVKVHYEHLSHEEFTYHINVLNKGTKTRQANVRIFLAPKHDELGNEIPLNKLRRLMVELDNFHEELQPGFNHIKRRSIDSSVTIGRKKTLTELLRDAGHSLESYCSCGWPDHLLIPKGNVKGMPFHLFVMITDHLYDMVYDHGKTGICTDAVSYCGAKDQLYPDKRAMGFPFDRKITVDTFNEWLQPNMFDKVITILHEKKAEDEAKR